MDKIELLKKRLEEIGVSLKNSENALALLALGSCGMDRDRMDQYSDLDFFVIVKDGYKQRYIDHLDWLENISPVGFKFKNTVDGYKFLFRDGVFCEFAVFEIGELKNIPYAEGRVIWKKEDFDETVCLPDDKFRAEKKKVDMEWLMGEVLTNIYVGLGRYQRGEKLSAFYFVQNYAVGRILDMIALKSIEKNRQADQFDQSRRFERRYPDMTKLLSDFMQGYDKTPESAKAIMEFLEVNFEINDSIKDMIFLWL